MLVKRSYKYLSIVSYISNVFSIYFLVTGQYYHAILRNVDTGNI